MTERDSPPPLVPDTALVERVVGRVLFWGGLLSIGVLIAGLVLYAARGDYRAHAGDLRDLRQQRTGQAAHVVLSLGQLVRGLAQHPIDPVTIMTLGVVVLLAVPVAGVAVAVPAFVVAGDRRYAIIAAAVLLVLALGFFLAGGIA